MFTLGFNSAEREELIELVSNSPKWIKRIKDSGGFYYPENATHFINTSISPRGCLDSGWCENCKIIVADCTCFCGGGKCPKCKNWVYGGTIPKDLNGVYERHYHNGTLKTIKQRFLDGKWVETLKDE